MYENGRRVNGYQRKRLHKRKMKKSYAKTWCWGNTETNWNSMVLMYKDEPRAKWGHPLDYWKEYSLSNPRTFSKKKTNRTLRRDFNNLSRKIIYSDFEDTHDYLPKVSNGTYRKYYDYDYNVW